MKSQILVTAFEPFLDHPQNSSAMLLQHLAQQRQDIETFILPVSFQQTFEVLQKHWKQSGPYKAVLMLGQAAGRDKVCLERVALNWMESSQPDNTGVSPQGQRINSEAPDSYLVDFFPSGWRDQLKKIGPTEISYSAGAYVCNNLYFKMVHELRATNTPALFVHVPLRPEQARAGEASLNGELQEQIVSGILDLMQSS